MSKTSNMARYKQLKEWWYYFSKTRKYGPRKKAKPLYTTLQGDSRIILEDDENY